MTAEERIQNALQAAAETHDSWRHRCHAVAAALGVDFGDPGWEMPDVARVRDRQIAHLERVLQAVLLFHRGGPWTAEDDAAWDVLAGLENDPSTRGLCDLVRSALARPDGSLPEPPGLAEIVAVIKPLAVFANRHDQTVWPPTPGARHVAVAVTLERCRAALKLYRRLMSGDPR